MENRPKMNNKMVLLHQGNASSYKLLKTMLKLKESGFELHILLNEVANCWVYLLFIFHKYKKNIVLFVCVI